MEKGVYEPVEIEVIAFDTEDVIATSDPTEMPVLPVETDS